MAAKTTTSSKPSKTPAAPAPAMLAKAPHGKPSKMAGKAAPAKLNVVAAVAAGAVTPTIQRNEDANAAPMTPKNFRNHPDMENFFRFIYENDLRIEALHIIDEIIVNRAARRKKGPSQANA